MKLKIKTMKNKLKKFVGTRVLNACVTPWSSDLSA